ncbi:DUF11 domain-containing protein [Spirosoma sp. KCTC 42546]|uniref:DUF11 domain-containing protein n=1 Tax=Spirosoma sp. KCTC 42546 TaxID=2520506 RepID=UPI001157BA16|nr:DUF11 domain-containing protein [Spirosoma sp. KCTC 42546]QDK82144.1 DUF11 domain-containing protein [Spirosoma sp. KCTC 42546]
MKPIKQKQPMVWHIRLLNVLLLSFILYHSSSIIANAQMTGQYPATLNVATAGATGITWYKDNVVIAGATASTYSATTGGTYSYKYTDPATKQTCTSLTITLVAAPTSDLGVSITPLTQTNNKGENQVYSIVVTNNGPDNAPNAVVKVPIPKGRSLVVAVPTQGSYDSGTQLWTIGSLANAATATMTLTIKVD